MQHAFARLVELLVWPAHQFMLSLHVGTYMCTVVCNPFLFKSLDSLPLPQGAKAGEECCDGAAHC